jgi:hypothetical protein
MKTPVDASATRQLTLRLPAGLLEQAKRLASARHTSVNQLVRRLLEESAAEARERELQSAYALLGADAAGADVEEFAAAQAEVAGRG